MQHTPDANLIETSAGRLRARAFIAVTALMFALVLGGWLLQRGLRRGNGSFERARMFEQVRARVANDFVDSIPEGELFRKAAEGLVRELHDPHSGYLTPEKLRSLTESTSGHYAGIGIQIDVRDGWITIVAPLPGTPAERAGIQPGDRIVAIDGKSTEGFSPDDARGLLRGANGSPLTLQIERPGVAARMSFKLARGEIRVHSVRHVSMIRDGVGYIDLTIFSDSSAAEVQQAVEKLRGQGMKTLVFDLRANPGGLLEQGIEVADLFLDSGQPIVSVRGRDAAQSFADGATQRWPDLRLITLVDDHSASASEIVAGALQDHDRAVIVGSTSYGKGSAQSVFPLVDSASALKLTTARWFTPSGRSIQKAQSPSSANDDDDDSVAGRAATAADSGAELPLSKRVPFRTDDGRVVYGGGGITPDLLVAPADSINGTRGFWRMIGAGTPKFRDALTESALAVKAAHTVRSPDFDVTDSLRQSLWQRVAAKGIKLDRVHYDSVSAVVNRLLGIEIARYALGPEAEFKRRVSDDRVIAAALELSNGAQVENDLLRRAGERRAAKREDIPHTT
ncbi:MAG: carboxyl-terminal protease [Gemmatimonadetes bacterium]|nr:carboxyl-terminal protease [Gemmatimonadota bacterium]